ncbi:hypothetical protein FA15DRAFT_665300 [Coprinopsis marcescibilis]|uniref:Survival motor neuron Tudor domain-containing protein n=1 Tax=Coprinopsis marcescibilis TaxID=230819 RepID=A0A5C3L6G5_COPMA|nr:hypothetical protein FA15DRAFT_665300 [Coprinopsis marcescibilis]
MNDRRLVSYADITQPYENQSHQSPPPKKRKKPNPRNKSNNTNRKSNITDTPHPSSTAASSNRGKNTAEESRELTHEEIWDDSALVDAWNAATEEYEAYHGPGKDWKQEPANKSALWYNVPPSEKAQDFTTVQDPQEDEDEGYPEQLENDVDGDIPQPAFDAPSYANYIPQDFDPSQPMPSQDEAFSRALNAMYWGGYWSAVYQFHRKLAPGPTQQAATTAGEAEESDEEMEQTENIDDGGFIDTQR